MFVFSHHCEKGEEQRTIFEKLRKTNDFRLSPTCLPIHKISPTHTLDAFISSVRENAKLSWSLWRKDVYLFLLKAKQKPSSTEAWNVITNKSHRCLDFNFFRFFRYILVGVFYPKKKSFYATFKTCVIVSWEQFFLTRWWMKPQVTGSCFSERASKRKYDE